MGSFAQSVPVRDHVAAALRFRPNSGRVRTKLVRVQPSLGSANSAWTRLGFGEGSSEAGPVRTLDGFDNICGGCGRSSSYAQPHRRPSVGSIGNARNSPSEGQAPCRRVMVVPPPLGGPESCTAEGRTWQASAPTGAFCRYHAPSCVRLLEPCAGGEAMRGTARDALRRSGQPWVSRARRP